MPYKPSVWPIKWLSDETDAQLIRKKKKKLKTM